MGRIDNKIEQCMMPLAMGMHGHRQLFNFFARLSTLRKPISNLTAALALFAVTTLTSALSLLALEDYSMSVGDGNLVFVMLATADDPAFQANPVYDESFDEALRLKYKESGL